MNFHLTTTLMVTFTLAASAMAGESVSVVNTSHNLSTSGRGNIRSTTETRVCIFCHSSHNSSSEGPLWSHETSKTGQFRTYARASLEATAEQPTGATKLCLSCHDGTIAVGAIKGLRNPISMKGVGSRGEIPDGRRTNIGMDLSGTHPVSIKYSQASALASSHLRWPPADVENRVGPDAEGYVQCTSCHDPHNDSRSTKYPFWQKDTFDAVCETCHTY